jgi:hypothetical protein
MKAGTIPHFLSQNKKGLQRLYTGPAIILRQVRKCDM